MFYFHVLINLFGNIVFSPSIRIDVFIVYIIIFFFHFDFDHTFYSTTRTVFFFHAIGDKAKYDDVKWWQWCVFTLSMIKFDCLKWFFLFVSFVLTLNSIEIHVHLAINSTFISIRSIFHSFSLRYLLCLWCNFIYEKNA